MVAAEAAPQRAGRALRSTGDDGYRNHGRCPSRTPETPWDTSFRGRVDVHPRPNLRFGFRAPISRRRSPRPPPGLGRVAGHGPGGRWPVDHGLGVWSRQAAPSTQVGEDLGSWASAPTCPVSSARTAACVPSQTRWRSTSAKAAFDGSSVLSTCTLFRGICSVRRENCRCTYTLLAGSSDAAPRCPSIASTVVGRDQGHADVGQRRGAFDLDDGDHRRARTGVGGRFERASYDRSGALHRRRGWPARGRGVRSGIGCDIAHRYRIRSWNRERQGSGTSRPRVDAALHRHKRRMRKASGLPICPAGGRRVISFLRCSHLDERSRGCRWPGSDVAVRRRCPALLGTPRRAGAGCGTARSRRPSVSAAWRGTSDQSCTWPRGFACAGSTRYAAGQQHRAFRARASGCSLADSAREQVAVQVGAAVAEVFATTGGRHRHRNRRIVPRPSPPGVQSRPSRRRRGSPPPSRRQRPGCRPRRNDELAGVMAMPCAPGRHGPGHRHSSSTVDHRPPRRWSRAAMPSRMFITANALVSPTAETRCSRLVLPQGSRSHVRQPRRCSW